MGLPKVVAYKLVQVQGQLGLNPFEAGSGL